MKPVLMIHEVDERLFDLPLENYVLTFDDGLYTQYQYIEELNKIKTEKIFFISSNIICVGEQSTEYIDCVSAHEKAFNGNTENYMTLEQIKHLMKCPNVTIGGHGHNHVKLASLNKMTHKIYNIVEDSKAMVKWFECNLGFKPTKFCFPYNDDFNGVYPELLRGLGFVDFYGSERIPVPFDNTAVSITH
jgi:peptidoglycan/xylan/chitin deacetylase (PgdA/CDA1 family)